MNIISFDIEEWYLEKILHKNTDNYKRFDELLNTILDILEEKSFQATFFCLGEMASCFPHVVKLIDSRGHEIGCHSRAHGWLNKMSYKEVENDTKQAIDSLEQCIGKKIISYRAPAFSIGLSNLWVFRILAENGIERDSSIFPSSRDLGGFKEFNQITPSIINYQGFNIKEFPIPMKLFMGRRMAYSGGGYFRLLPLSVIRNELFKSDYSMLYFHLADMDSVWEKFLTKKKFEYYFKEPGFIFSRFSRFLKTNLGKKKALRKFKKLLDFDSFYSIDQAVSNIDWCTVPIVHYK